MAREWTVRLSGQSLVTASMAVSYTHLDVYKRQDRYLPTAEEKAASSELMENIVQQDYAASRNLILIYENKNTQDIQLEITVTYYDENDNLLFLRNNYIWSCPAGGKACLLYTSRTDTRARHRIIARKYR